MTGNSWSGTDTSIRPYSVVPEQMGHSTSWTADNGYNSGGGLAQAQSPMMGPSWFPGPQHGVNYGTVDNRTFVSDYSPEWFPGPQQGVHYGNVKNRVFISGNGIKPAATVNYGNVDGAVFVSGHPGEQASLPVGRATVDNGVYFTSGVHAQGGGPNNPVNYGTVSNRVLVSGNPSREGSGLPVGRAVHTPDSTFFTSGIHPQGSGPNNPIHVGAQNTNRNQYTFVSSAPFAEVSLDRSGGHTPKFNAQHRQVGGLHAKDNTVFVSGVNKPPVTPSLFGDNPTTEWATLGLLALGIFGAAWGLATARTIKQERPHLGQYGTRAMSRLFGDDEINREAIIAEE